MSILVNLTLWKVLPMSDQGQPDGGIYVYVISGEHGRFKIGASDYPPRRLRELQTGSPFKLNLEFVGATEGFAYKIEAEAHFMLHQHRVEGEWFVVPLEVATSAVMAAAYRLGHTVKPIDPDQVPWPSAPTSAPRVVRSRDVPMWGQWTTFGLAMVAFFAVILKTDHFLTALISAMIVLGLSMSAMKLLIRQGVITVPQAGATPTS
jgi:hypothetical protein